MRLGVILLLLPVPGTTIFSVFAAEVKFSFTTCLLVLLCFFSVFSAGVNAHFTSVSDTTVFSVFAAGVNVHFTTCP